MRAAILLAALVPLGATAEPSAYRIDSSRTRAEFEVEHLGILRAHGKFENVSGTLSYDAAAQSGTIDLAIPTRDGDADNERGDDVANWLVENSSRIGVQLVIWDRTVWVG